MYAVALIDEARCIGCAKCLPACPVDAIVGAEGFMHTVITVECIGCKLCLPPCPVDCIEMKEVADKPFDDAVARGRVKARKTRLARLAAESAARRRQLKSSPGHDPVAAALARAKGNKP